MKDISILDMVLLKEEVKEMWESFSFSVASVLKRIEEEGESFFIGEEYGEIDKEGRLMILCDVKVELKGLKKKLTLGITIPNEMWKWDSKEGIC